MNAAEGTLFERFGRHDSAGTILFYEGDVGREMFVIQAGRIRLSRKVGGVETELAVLPPGEFFGEMSIVNNRPRSATAVVLEDAKLLVIDGKTFEAMIRGNAEIAVRMIQKLASRLEQANTQIEVLLLKDTNHRVVQFLRRTAERRGGQPEGGGVRVGLTRAELAEKVGIDDAEVRAILERLQRARLVLPTEGDHGFLIPEVGRLQEFIEFLEMKDRYGGG